MYFNQDGEFHKSDYQSGSSRPGRGASFGRDDEEFLRSQKRHFDGGFEFQQLGDNDLRHMLAREQERGPPRGSSSGQGF